MVRCCYFLLLLIRDSAFQSDAYQTHWPRCPPSPAFWLLALDGREQQALSRGKPPSADSPRPAPATKLTAIPRMDAPPPPPVLQPCHGAGVVRGSRENKVILLSVHRGASPPSAFGGGIGPAEARVASPCPERNTPHEGEVQTVGGCLSVLDSPVMTCRMAHRSADRS